MNLPPFLEDHKALASSIIGMILFGALGFYVIYLSKTDTTAVTTDVSSSQALFSQEFVLFLQAVNKQNLSLKDTSFNDSYLVRNARNFTQEINPSLSRGRIDPFVPYAATGYSR